ncbi:MAG TPA: sugar phosphate isomerase/epimerase [Armatimonadetes bacterium]|nr:sugar phosphate isomerase/epimerase [Armatimonadota bacterium]
MNVGISTVCFARHFAQGELDLFQLLAKCSDFGLNAIEMHQGQTPREKEVLRQVKQQAARLSLDIMAVSPESNFYKARAEEMEGEVQHLLRWLEVADFLGAPILRVNTGPYCRSIHDFAPAHVTREEIFAWAVAAFQTVAAEAGERGITLAVENHFGLCRTSADLLRLVQAVDSEWFKVNIDTGNWYDDLAAHEVPFEDPYAAIAALAGEAVFCHAKVWEVTADLVETTLDYPRIFRLFREHGYRGPVSIEYFGEDVLEATPRLAAMLRQAHAQAEASM